MADNLWALREQKRLSVATLATRAGLPIGLIMEYESGQRNIDPRHLNRIAKALYVEESEIRLESDPRPGAAPLERQPRREEPRPPAPPPPPPSGAAADLPPRPRERGARPQRTFEPRPPGPARASQIAHLQGLLMRLGRSESRVETELGKPLGELDRLEVSKLIGELQAELRSGTAERHRPYLPEAVDQYEMQYLTKARDSGIVMRFRLFDNATLTGQIVGFGPYNITIRHDDGSETTINKLAIVTYTRTGPFAATANGKEPHE